MPRIHVCSLAMIGAKVEETGARRLITLISNGTHIDRPRAIAPQHHLYIAMSDIIEPQIGQIVPGKRHVRTLLEFIHDWNRAEPLLIHCYAGVSRSTAAAFITACALGPSRSEVEIARAIRAASPTATPNARLVALGDAILERDGRMIAAIGAIGRGEDCVEGVPFALELV
jgi:predicted protein tyrosine phosphatase